MNGRHERVIEAAWGLGEVVVAGLVVPDNYVLDASGNLLSSSIGTKDIALRPLPDGGTIEEEVRAELVDAPCLDDRELAALNELADRCETRFGRGLDLEWGFAEGELFLLQCRAITRNA
jgi:phosphoenolpyruvate synthase/pyruvate phosphate dikinase